VSADTQKIVVPGGLLVAVEGIDGAGKSTQVRALGERLRGAGLEVVQTHEPTGGKWGQLLRASAQTGRFSPEEELNLFLEDRKEHVEALLRPSLAAGKVVLVDRYYFSTAAYQGPRGFDVAELLRRNEAFAPRPDLLVLLELEPKEGLGRVGARGDKANAFEREESLAQSAQVFRALRSEHYVGAEGDFILALDARQPSEEVTRQVLARVGALLRAKPWATGAPDFGF
jgi:dTMP kinase